MTPAQIHAAITALKERRSVLVEMLGRFSIAQPSPLSGGRIADGAEPDTEATAIPDPAKSVPNGKELS